MKIYKKIIRKLLNKTKILIFKDWTDFNKIVLIIIKIIFLLKMKKYKIKARMIKWRIKLVHIN